MEPLEVEVFERYVMLRDIYIFHIYVLSTVQASGRRSKDTCLRDLGLPRGVHKSQHSKAVAHTVLQYAGTISMYICPADSVQCAGAYGRKWYAATSPQSCEPCWCFRTT